MTVDWTIEQIRDVVASRQFIVVGGSADDVCDYLDQPEHDEWPGGDARGDPPPGVVVDVTSAHALVSVYDGLSPANQAKLLAMPLVTATAIAWRLLTPKPSTT